MKNLNLEVSAFTQGEVLTRSELKNVLGGSEPIGVGRCSSGSCTIDVSGHGSQPGVCETNSQDKCVCRALDYPSSALDNNCVK
ncbi:MAG: hypothetical protein V4663_16730 [Bacteroidota bacterium]